MSEGPYDCYPDSLHLGHLSIFGYITSDFLLCQSQSLFEYFAFQAEIIMDGES